MYDAIIVGARCAGSLTATLLARCGHRVLLLDRDSFGSDILCAHHVNAPGVGALAKHGLLERLLASGCPIADRTTVFIPRTRVELVGATICPRRRVLDGLLAQSAADAGSEVRDRFTVTDLVWDDDRVVGIVGHGESRRSVVESARIVVGADGRHSFVAAAVGAERYLDHPATSCCYYAYWQDVTCAGPELHLEERRAIGLFPTHEGQTCVVVTRPVADWVAFKRAPEAMYMAQVERFPEVFNRLCEAQRMSRFFGTADVGSAFRCGWGPGWVLVGDAGHHRAPLLGGGMGDALVQADLLADALDGGLTARVPLDEAVAFFQQARDDIWGPLHEATFALASFSWSLSALPGRIDALDLATQRTAEALHGGPKGTVSRP